VETGYLDFSVILNVEHGGHFLRNALLSAQRLDWPTESFEIIVVGSDKDRDARKQVLKASDDTHTIRFLTSSVPTSAARLNTACTAARGCVLTFADDDCELAQDWLHKIDAVFKANPDAGLIGGVDALRSSANAFSVALDCVLGSFIGTAGCRNPNGPRLGRSYPKLQNMAIKRELAQQVVEARDGDTFHLFDERLTVHLDVDLAKRVEHLGKRALMSPDIVVYHWRDTTFWKFLQRNFMMAQTSRLIGVHRLAHTVLAASGAVAILLAVGALWSQYMRVALAICIAVYCALLFWCALRGYWQTRKPAVLGLIPSLLAGVHMARALGYVVPARHTR
jgi:GT2 family glycosyltransferase